MWDHVCTLGEGVAMTEAVTEDERTMADRRPWTVAVGVLSLLLSAGAIAALVSVVADPETARSAFVDRWMRERDPGTGSPLCPFLDTGTSVGSPDEAWNLAAAVLVAGAAVTAGVVARRNRSPWAMLPSAAVGVVLVVAGTGLGRHYVAVDGIQETCTYWIGLRVQWGWIVAGLVLGLGALLLTVHRRRMESAAWWSVVVVGGLSVLGSLVPIWLGSTVEPVRGFALVSGPPVHIPDEAGG
jgi:hypothetical protein